MSATAAEATPTTNGHPKPDLEGEPAAKRAKLDETVDVTTEENAAALERFCEYIRIPTVHPDPDYTPCVKFLEGLAEWAGLSVRTFELTPNKPITVMTWQGTNPQLPSIVLNSHTDVVPVELEHWDVDPFAAHRADNGDIYGRGTQDMKCVGMQYIEAIYRLKSKGVTFPRTIHISFVPDEEIGGTTGTEKWVLTDDFASLNVGIALDEGLANPTDKFTVFYGERAIFWVTVTAEGSVGHGSRFVDNTAVYKLLDVLNTSAAFREAQKKVLEDDPCGKKLGDVITLNNTYLRAGSEARQYNVIPGSAEAGFDIRLPPHYPIDEVKRLMDEWTAAEGLSYSYVFAAKKNPVSEVESTQPWWSALETAFAKAGVEYETEIFPAGTDGRYFRGVGVPCYGFSPMNNTPVLLHDHNERLNEVTYIKGIKIYEDIITSLATTELEGTM